jgi:hypothetical protein
MRSGSSSRLEISNSRLCSGPSGRLRCGRRAACSIATNARVVQGHRVGAAGELMGRGKPGTQSFPAWLVYMANPYVFLNTHLGAILVSVAVLCLVVGFVAGFAVRAWISHRRRRAWMGRRGEPARPGEFESWLVRPNAGADAPNVINVDASRRSD